MNLNPIVLLLFLFLVFLRIWWLQFSQPSLNGIFLKNFKTQILVEENSLHLHLLKIIILFFLKSVYSIVHSINNINIIVHMHQNIYWYYFFSTLDNLLNNLLSLFTSSMSFSFLILLAQTRSYQIMTSPFKNYLKSRIIITSH